MAVLILGCFAVQFSLVCLPGLGSPVQPLHTGLHVKAVVNHFAACVMQDSWLSTVSKQEQVLVLCRCGDVQEVSE